MCDPEAIISAYGLSSHPEGGWYREFHRSRTVFGNLPGYPGPRAAVTAIYFCLKEGEFSAFHRLRSEEVWLHLAGGPLELVLLEPGNTRSLRISPAGAGGSPAAVVPAGTIQAARPVGGFAFVACIVVPGFDFADFEMPTREELLAGFPDSAPLVRSLTR
jgi:predicted cupin superfamily sugar epimerase